MASDSLKVQPTIENVLLELNDMVKNNHEPHSIVTRAYRRAEKAVPPDDQKVNESLATYAELSLPELPAKTKQMLLVTLDALTHEIYSAHMEEGTVTIDNVKNAVGDAIANIIQGNVENESTHGIFSELFRIETKKSEDQSADETEETDEGEETAARTVKISGKARINFAKYATYADTFNRITSQIQLNRQQIDDLDKRSVHPVTKDKQIKELMDDITAKKSELAELENPVSVNAFKAALGGIDTLVGRGAEVVKILDDSKVVLEKNKGSDKEALAQEYCDNLIKVTHEYLKSEIQKSNPRAPHNVLDNEAKDLLEKAGEIARLEELNEAQETPETKTPVTEETDIFDEAAQDTESLSPIPNTQNAQPARFNRLEQEKRKKQEQELKDAQHKQE